ncbi:MAG: hypothetical protein JW885_07000 [Deltaproteobacteria bacterium]|nr:hypothetical protein [Candidatus Zymogenaceae bacterium]
MGSWELFSIPTLLFLAAVFVAAYLLKRAFSDEILTIVDVAEELSSLLYDGGRFQRHTKTYLIGKPIVGEGEMRGLRHTERGVTAITLRDHVYTSEADIGVEMVLLFFSVDAPTEIEAGDVAAFRGVLMEAGVAGGGLRLVIDVSELTHVGPDDEPDL